MARTNPSKQHQNHTTSLGCIRYKMDERNNPCTPETPIFMLSTYSQAHVRKIPQQTWDFTLLIATQKNFFCFVLQFWLELELKHHFLTPLQDAAPHVQSKQHLKLFLIISESVDCLVCSDEDLRRNILTDFASIIWLIVSIHIYIFFFHNALLHY